MYHDIANSNSNSNKEGIVSCCSNDKLACCLSNEQRNDVFKAMVLTEHGFLLCTRISSAVVFFIVNFREATKSNGEILATCIYVT
jgi:hypothetical protein